MSRFSSSSVSFCQCFIVNCQKTCLCYFWNTGFICGPYSKTYLYIKLNQEKYSSIGFFIDFYSNCKKIYESLYFVLSFVLEYGPEHWLIKGRGFSELQHYSTYHRSRLPILFTIVFATLRSNDYTVLSFQVFAQPKWFRIQGVQAASGTNQDWTG